MPLFPLQFFGFLLGLLAAYCWWIEPCRLQITRYDVSGSDKPLSTPIRVLLLTDWHLGRFSRPDVLRAKMARLQREHDAAPFDLVLLGGDYVDFKPSYLQLLTPCLDALRRLGVPMCGVLGNHDHTSFGEKIEPVTAFLEGGGVAVLRNQSLAVTVRGQRLLIVGLDDLQEASDYYDSRRYHPPAHYKDAAGKMDWYSRFDGTEQETPRLLLSHNPDGVYLPGRNPLAVLSGHTHGGQIMLLDWISRPLHRRLHVHLPPGSAVTWAGRRTIHGRTLIVSRGIEGSAIPLRLLRPPEAVVVTLR